MTRRTPDPEPYRGPQVRVSIKNPADPDWWEPDPVPAMVAALAAMGHESTLLTVGPEGRKKLRAAVDAFHRTLAGYPGGETPAVWIGVEDERGLLVLRDPDTGRTLDGSGWGHAVLATADGRVLVTRDIA